MHRLLFLFFAVLIGATPAAASKVLDQTRVHALYNEGDFEGVLDLIGRFRSANPVHSRGDSIFIARHLSVVYAADPKSVGQGKYWMNELLKLMPAADLVGMYVSNEIERIFENVRKEYLSRQKSFGADTTGIVLPTRPPSAPISASPGESLARTRPGVEAGASPSSKTETIAEADGASNPSRAFWIAGSTLAAVAVGATVYFLASSSDAEEPEEFVIPRNQGE